MGLQVSPDGFAAIKMTALGNPALLERWSTARVEIAALFGRIQADAAAADGPTYTTEDGENALDWPAFLRGYESLFNVPDEEGLRRAFDRHASTHSHINADEVSSNGVEEEPVMVLDALEWCAALDVRDMAGMAAHCRHPGPFTAAALDEGEQALVMRMVERVEGLAQLASVEGVRLMIDAEHSYFQPAIDQLVVELQRKYNAKAGGVAPIIFNTYQCYLKDAGPKVDAHIALAEREGWHFAAKLVRGAYMQLERTRSETLGLADPIHDTLNDTHACYDDAISTILRRNAVSSGASAPNLLVATHNQASIEHTGAFPQYFPTTFRLLFD